MFLGVQAVTLTITFGMVFSTTWLEFKDMEQDPLVRREPVSASCNRRPDEGLETQKYSLYPKELHVLKFQPRRTKHHAKRDRQCRSANSERLMTLIDLSPADFRQFLTVLDGRMRVWRHKNTACTPRNIQPTVPYGNGNGLGVYLS
jgi:hypothetical protein